MRFSNLKKIEKKNIEEQQKKKSIHATIKS